MVLPDILISVSFPIQAKVYFSRQWIKSQDTVHLVPQGMVKEEKMKHSELKVVLSDNISK